MRHYLLTAAGPDRSGIVAAVTKLLFHHGCNLEDSAMTQLRGEFAILLIFTDSEKTDGEKLKTALKELEKTEKLIVHLKAMDEGEARAPKPPAKLCLVTVYGADQPGLVYHVTEALAQHKVNVTDVTTHRTSAQGRTPAGYILYIEGELPSGLPMDKLSAALGELGKKLGLTVAVKAAEPVAL